MKQQWTIEYRNWIGASEKGLMVTRIRQGRGKWRHRFAEIPGHVVQYLHLAPVPRRGSSDMVLSSIHSESELWSLVRVVPAKRSENRFMVSIDAPVREVAKNYERTYEPETIRRTLRDYDSPWQLYRAKYKYTDCGPSLGVETSHETLYCDSLPGTWDGLKGRVKAIIVSSIVEGVDACTDTHRVLCYPLGTLSDRLDAAVTAVNDEATDIWNATHGCPDCGDELDGAIPINPECKSCHGEGVIL